MESYNKGKMHHAKMSMLSSTKNGKNKKLSSIPQSVAARERRHKISNRFKILQSLIPGGSKMDTASMLEEAIKYVKFLKTQIWLHQLLIDYHYDGNHINNSDHYGPLSDALPHYNNNDNNIVINKMGVDEEHAMMSQVSFENCCFQDEEQLLYFDADTIYYSSSSL